MMAWTPEPDAPPRELTDDERAVDCTYEFPAAAPAGLIKLGKAVADLETRLNERMDEAFARHWERILALEQWREQAEGKFEHVNEKFTDYDDKIKTLAFNISGEDPDHKAAEQKAIEEAEEEARRRKAEKEREEAEKDEATRMAEAALAKKRAEEEEVMLKMREEALAAKRDMDEMRRRREEEEKRLADERRQQASRARWRCPVSCSRSLRVAPPATCARAGGTHRRAARAGREAGARSDGETESGHGGDDGQDERRHGTRESGACAGGETTDGRARGQGQGGAGGAREVAARRRGGISRSAAEAVDGRQLRGQATLPGCSVAQQR